MEGLFLNCQSKKSDVALNGQTVLMLLFLILVFCFFTPVLLATYILTPNFYPIYHLTPQKFNKLPIIDENEFSIISN